MTIQRSVGGSRRLSVVFSLVSWNPVGTDFGLGRETKVTFVQQVGVDLESGELGDGGWCSELAVDHIFQEVVGDQVLGEGSRVH
jgi:hypothetical protein